MYAVIKTGGKQYRVSSGEKVKVEQMAAEVGSQITIDQVLMVADGDKITIGTPLVKGAKVQATVVDQGRADKIHVFKCGAASSRRNNRVIGRITPRSRWTRSRSDQGPFRASLPKEQRNGT